MDNPLVRLDPGLFLWTIATFLVLLALLTKFAWKPLLEALDSRQQAIKKSLDDAQQARQEMERLKQEAALLGAHGVIGVRLEVGGYDWAENALEFTAIGTAVLAATQLRASHFRVTSAAG